MSCKKEFPQLVRLHEKFAAEGLAAVSVSLDTPADQAKVLKFLQGDNKFLNGKKAGFTNLILDESQEFWQAKFKISGPPCVFVFNRQGEWRRFEGETPYVEAEKFVAECLKR